MSDELRLRSVGESVFQILGLCLSGLANENLVGFHPQIDEHQHPHFPEATNNCVTAESWIEYLAALHRKCYIPLKFLISRIWNSLPLHHVMLFTLCLRYVYRKHKEHLENGWQTFLSETPLWFIHCEDKTKTKSDDIGGDDVQCTRKCANKYPISYIYLYMNSSASIASWVSWYSFQNCTAWLKGSKNKTDLEALASGDTSFAWE